MKFQMFDDITGTNFPKTVKFSLTITEPSIQQVAHLFKTIN